MNEFLSKNIAIVSSSIALILIVALPVGTFFSTFNGNVSHDQQDWGDFGSYLSGTVGVFAACLAVVWLMISVHLQKIELNQLKKELMDSANEQKKQTYIGALTAVLNASTQTLAQYQSSLIALNNGEAHLHPMEDRVNIHMRMDDEYRKMKFYHEQMEAYLEEKYIGHEDAELQTNNGESPF